MTKLKFYKKSHKYKYGKHELTSVTEFISQFFEPFDINKIAKIKAIISRRKGEKGKGVRYWKKLWKEARETGTEVHKQLENYLNYGMAPVHPKALQGQEAYKELCKKTGIIVEDTEVIVYDMDYKLAGTIDVLALTKDKEVVLVDWKTNSRIHFKGYKNKKAKTPLEEFEDCNYVKYMLQLSLYAYIIEKESKNFIKELYIVHLRDNDYSLIKVPYMKDTIKKMLEVKDNGKETN